MPRKPRAYMAGIPCHVVHRGNNRDACFYADQDFSLYLDSLGMCAVAIELLSMPMR